MVKKETIISVEKMMERKLDIFKIPAEQRHEKADYHQLRSIAENHGYEVNKIRFTGEEKIYYCFFKSEQN